MKEKRAPGRPKVLEPRASVSVWLPVSAHDRIMALAKKEERSISATVRALLQIRLNR